VTFISRRAVTAELDAGALAEVHVEDMDLQRQISIARAANRTPSRAADTFVAFARERLT
jgi:DNA-binding transcriptional LysR family regulator